MKKMIAFAVATCLLSASLLLTDDTINRSRGTMDPDGRGWSIDPMGGYIGASPTVDPYGRGPGIDPDGHGWTIDPNGGYFAEGARIDPLGRGFSIDPNGAGSAMDPNGIVG